MDVVILLVVAQVQFDKFGLKYCSCHGCFLPTAIILNPEFLREQLKIAVLSGRCDAASSPHLHDCPIVDRQRADAAASSAKTGRNFSARSMSASARLAIPSSLRPPNSTPRHCPVGELSLAPIVGNPWMDKPSGKFGS